MNKLNYLSGFIIMLILLSSCVSTKPPMTISHYRYEYNDQKFRIRSVNCEIEGDCYNELIGETFLAVDYNQDRIIDRILMGEADLHLAQSIYEHGLTMLAQENRLEVHPARVTRFIQTESCCSYEIKSFGLENEVAFNQLVVIRDRDTQNPVTTVAVDQNANGTLDEVIKGPDSLENLQVKYSSMINTGLETGKLKKMDGIILVQ